MNARAILITLCEKYYSSSEHPIIDGKELSFEEWGPICFYSGPMTIVEEVNRYGRA